MRKINTPPFKKSYFETWYIQTTLLINIYPNISFLFWPLVPTHCKCRRLLLRLITLSDTLAIPWTKDRFVTESSIWQHTTFTRDRHPCHRRDSNPQSQQARGRRPTPQTAPPLGSATWILRCFVINLYICLFNCNFGTLIVYLCLKLWAKSICLSGVNLRELTTLRTGYGLSSVERSASLFPGTAASHLMLYLSDILLSFITPVVLLASEISSFSYLIAQFCWCTCLCSLNSSRHDIKPLHLKTVLWSFNNPISSSNLWVSYFLALTNSHLSELTEVSLLNIRILGQYIHQYSTCFAFTCLCVCIL
jgi:hypothetical protein